MATRLYVTTTAAGYTPPTIRGSWDRGTADTTGTLNGHLVRALASAKSGAQSSSATQNETSAHRTGLIYRFVSEPLAGGQTIGGTLSLCLRVSQSGSNSDKTFRLHVYLVDASNNVRGTLLTNYHEALTATNEWVASNQFTNTFDGFDAPASLSAVTAEVGDRIVVEIGYRAATGVIGSIGRMFTGGTGVDGTPGSTSTTAAGWIEFSDDFVFGDYSVVTNQVAADAYLIDNPIAEGVVTFSADGVVQAGYAEHVSASALVHAEDLEREVNADAVVSLPLVELDLSASAIVRATTVRSISASGIVFATNTQQISGTGWLVEQLNVEITADGLIVPGLDVTAGGLVRETALFQLYGDALVRAETTVNLTSDGHVSSNDIIELEADATVTGAMWSTLPADSLVLEAFVTEFDGDGWLAEEMEQDLLADGNVVLPGEIEVNADATLEGEMWGELSGHGVVRETFTRELGGDGWVTWSFSRDLIGDGVVIMPLSLSSAVIADGRVSATPSTEVRADALVSLDRGTGRYVSWQDGHWDQTTTWRIALAERVDGDRLVAPNLTQPFTFGMSYAASVLGLAVAADVSSWRDAGGEIQLVLERFLGSWQQLATVTLSEEARLPARQAAAGAKAAWYLVALGTPVALDTNQSYRVRAIGDRVNVLATRGGEMVNGQVLNCVVVGSDMPTFRDRRPCLIAPITASGGPVGTRTVTVRGVDPHASDITIGAGATLTINPTVTLDFSLAGTLLINPGGHLSLTPGGTVRQRIVGAPGARVVVDGRLTMQGTAKTRYGRLASQAEMATRNLILTEPPTGWQAGDRVMVLEENSRGESVSRTVQSVTGTQVTLTSSLGVFGLAGMIVVNESRAVELAGAGAGAPMLFLPRDRSVVELTHVTLRSLGPGISLPCADDATISLADVVVVDGRRLGETTGTVGVRLGWKTTAANLAVLRCRGGVHLPRGCVSPSGELILGSLGAPDLGFLVEASAALNLLAVDLWGGVVSLTAGARFRGAIEARAVKGDSALIACIAGGAAAAELTGGALRNDIGWWEDYDGGIVRIDAGAGLGRLSARGISTSFAAAWFRPGAGFLGNAELIGCALEESRSLVQIESGAVFVDLVLLDTIGPSSSFSRLVDGSGSLLPGSRVANRDTTVTAHGTITRSTPGYAGGEALRLTARAGETLMHEVARLAVEGGELIGLRFAAKGSGRARVENPAITAGAEITITAENWHEFELFCSSTAAGVVRLVVETTGTLEIDAVGRS